MRLGIRDCTSDTEDQRLYMGGDQRLYKGHWRPKTVLGRRSKTVRGTLGITDCTREEIKDCMTGDQRLYERHWRSKTVRATLEIKDCTRQVIKDCTIDTGD